jgi:hypothetical protein
MMELKSWLK